MCNAASCGAGAACVANRCQSDAGAAALVHTRRFVLDPTEVAFIQRGSARRPGELPASVTLGRASEGPATVLLRFDVPPDLDLVEAYLLVDPSEDAVAEGHGVPIHAERVIGPWDARSATWTEAPELRDVRAPSACISGGAVGLRLDVLPLFARPHGAEPPDQGIALLADGLSPRGASVVLVPGMSSPLVGEPAPSDRAPLHGPRLELYAK
jgi:hypothetical protein